MKFGSVLVKDGKVIGRGWNRLSTKEDRALLSHVDYASHGEQSAIIDAIKKGFDPTNGTIYVLGYGAKNKKLSIRDGKFFTCRKCPHGMMKYNIKVMIPTPKGWVKLSAEEALESAKEHKGYWKRHIQL